MNKGIEKGNRYTCLFKPLISQLNLLRKQHLDTVQAIDFKNQFPEKLFKILANILKICLLCLM